MDDFPLQDELSKKQERGISENVRVRNSEILLLHKSNEKFSKSTFVTLETNQRARSNMGKCLVKKHDCILVRKARFVAF